MNKKRGLPRSAELTVLPEIEPPNEFFEMLPLLSGAFESYYKGSGSDLHSIRDYRMQDSGRFLDWKASAKTGQLMVREFTKEDDRKCCFVFDNTVSGFEDHDRPAFEKAVRLCASALRHFQEMDCETRLVTPLQATRYGQSEAALIEKPQDSGCDSAATDRNNRLAGPSFRGLLQDCFYCRPSWRRPHGGLEFRARRVLARTARVKKTTSFR